MRVPPPHVLLISSTAIVGPPQSFRVAESQPHAITLSWIAPDGDVTVVHYSLTCNDSEHSSSSFTTSNTTFDLTATNLMPYTNYTCSLRALTAAAGYGLAAVIDVLTPFGRELFF